MNKVDSIINNVLTHKGEMNVLHTKLVGNNTIWKKVIVEACGWNNKDDAYKFFKYVEMGDKTIALAYMCYNYSKHIVKYAEKVYNYYNERLNKKEFLKNIYILENPLFRGMFNAKYNECVEDCGNFISWNEVFAMGKKFDLVVMNPPYAGKGDPLFMKISKVIYENCLSDAGRLVSINPTSVVDKTIYSENDEDAPYSNMRVSDFVFSDEFSDVFDGADIKTGIGIFKYSKEGHSLYSDWIREKRFGKDEWKFRKDFIGKIFTEYTIGRISDFFSVVDSDKKERVRKSSKFESLYKNKYFVIISQLTGGKKNGKSNWDWLTLHSKDYLKVMKTLPDIHYHGIPFDSKDDAINLIKWINTDFVMYVLNHYKFNVSNTKTILDRIPSFTLLNGDFSDENICKVFSITHDEMSVIHNDMKNFGNKFHLGKTEAQLMEYIDEINK